MGGFVRHLFFLAIIQYLFIAVSFANEYDQIIIGSGPTACGYALQLDTSEKVILLERGPDNLEAAKNLSGWPRILNEAGEWVHSSEQATVAIPNVLGGGASINAGVLLQSDKEWVLRAIPGVKWRDFLSAYGFIYHHLNLDEPSFNSSDIKDHKIVRALKDGLLDLGYESLQSRPTLEAEKRGFFVPVSLFTKDGTRRSLISSLKQQGHVEIRSNTLVERILIENGKAIGVLLSNQEKLWLSPKGKIVLSAGAIYSPFLLLKSGVGEEKQLNKFGIEKKAINPYVGKGLIDHFAVAMSMHLSEDLPLASVPLLVNDEHFAMEFVFGGRLTKYFSGLTQAFKPQHARREKCTKDWFSYQDMLPAPIERLINNQLTFIVINKRSPDIPGHVGLKLHEGQLRPKIKLPSIDDKIINDLRKGLRLAFRLMETRAVKELPQSQFFNHAQGTFSRLLSWYFGATMPDFNHQNKVIPAPPSFDNKEAFRSWLIEYNISPFHYAGTLQLGLATSLDFKLDGLDNVVVADASLLGLVTPHNPQLTLMALGAYIARVVNQSKQRCAL